MHRSNSLANCSYAPIGLLSIFVTTEGFEPTFSHPITIICLEGKLVYVAIFCSFTGTQTQILDLGNPCPIQLNDEAMCGLSKIRTCIFGFVDRCPNPLDDETVVPLIGFEPTFATPLQITVSKTELVTLVSKSHVRCSKSLFGLYEGPLFSTNPCNVAHPPRFELGTPVLTALYSKPLSYR